jgi:hypothetical protein
MMNCGRRSNKQAAVMNRRQAIRRIGAGCAWGTAWLTASAEPVLAENLGAYGRLPTIHQIRAAEPGYWMLVDLINDYRRRSRLPEIELSRRLTVVAALHVRDLAHRMPHADGASLHSWSLDSRWIGGQYRTDQQETWPIMWEKPKELTGYPGYGFEIAAAKVRDPHYALEAWQRSPSHLNVILNRDLWDDERWQWQAIGAAFYQGYACAWFGDRPDA